MLWQMRRRWMRHPAAYREGYVRGYVVGGLTVLLVWWLVG